jgi:hypothetical protein
MSSNKNKVFDVLCNESRSVTIRVTAETAAEAEMKAGRGDFEDKDVVRTSTLDFIVVESQEAELAVPPGPERARKAAVRSPAAR